MKKIASIFLLVSSLFFANFCFALNAPEEGTEDLLPGIADVIGYSTEDVTDVTLSQNIGLIIKSVLGLIGVLFFVLTFYAGFLWMTASGDDAKIEKAKNIITAATIGLAIIIMAYSITTLVINSLNRAVTPTNTIGK